MHPTRSDISRKENGHEVRADHSQNHYANEQHLTPLETRKLLTESPRSLANYFDQP